MQVASGRCSPLVAAVAAAAFGTLILPQPAVAANAWHTARPTQVQPYADGSFTIQLDTDAGSTCPNQAGSGGADTYLVKSGQNGVTADAVRNMLSVALTAHSLGRQVSLYYDGATSSCYVNRLLIRDY